MTRKIEDKDLEKVSGGRDACKTDGTPLTPPEGERTTPQKEDDPGDDETFNRG